MQESCDRAVLETLRYAVDRELRKNLAREHSKKAGLLCAG
jgi:hypothetical protein